MNNLKKMILEAFVVLKEAELSTQQAPAPQNNAPQPPQPSNNAPMPQQQPQGEQTLSTDNAQQPNQTPATIDALIEKINIIRAGKSFGEPSIYKAISDMYDGIEEQKKMTVQEIVKKIADTLTQASANLTNETGERNQDPMIPPVQPTQPNAQQSNQMVNQQPTQQPVV